MLWEKKSNIAPEDIENLIWFGTRDNKSQWMDKDFYDLWMRGMESAFRIIGMLDRFEMFIKEKDTSDNDYQNDNLIVKVQGIKNRQLLSRSMEKMKGVSPLLVLNKAANGAFLMYVEEKAKSLDAWKKIVDLLKYTTVVALATQGFRYYVEGSQVGYEPKSRHLFKKSNTLKMLGTPNEPKWVANISGYRIVIIGEWKEIEKTQDERGLNILQMLQLRLNEEVERLIK